MVDDGRAVLAVDLGDEAAGVSARRSMVVLQGFRCLGGERGPQWDPLSSDGLQRNLHSCV